MWVNVRIPLPFGWRFGRDRLNYRAIWLGWWGARSLPLVLWAKDNRAPGRFRFPAIERLLRVGAFRPLDRNAAAALRARASEQEGM